MDLQGHIRVNEVLRTMGDGFGGQCPAAYIEDPWEWEFHGQQSSTDRSAEAYDHVSHISIATTARPARVLRTLSSAGLLETEQSTSPEGISQGPILRLLGISGANSSILTFEDIAETEG